MIDEDSMPVDCSNCGELFDFGRGNPCHHCNGVFCRECAECTDEYGWICNKCREEREVQDGE